MTHTLRNLDLGNDKMTRRRRPMVSDAFLESYRALMHVRVHTPHVHSGRRKRLCLWCMTAVHSWSPAHGVSAAMWLGDFSLTKRLRLNLICVIDLFPKISHLPPYLSSLSVAGFFFFKYENISRIQILCVWDFCKFSQLKLCLCSAFWICRTGLLQPREPLSDEGCSSGGRLGGCRGRPVPLACSPCPWGGRLAQWDKMCGWLFSLSLSQER